MTNRKSCKYMASNYRFVFQRYSLKMNYKLFVTYINHHGKN